MIRFSVGALLIVVIGFPSAATLSAPPADGARSNKTEQPVATGPRTDLYGDALPPDATARLGSVRLRHGALDARAVAFARDGKSLVTANSEGVVCVWDAQTGKRTRRIRLVFEYQSQNVALSRNADLLASAAGDRVQIWSVATGKELKKFDRQGGINWLVFSPDGKILAVSSGGDHVIRLVSVATGDDVGEIKGRFPRPLSFSPDGKLLVASNSDKTIPVFEVAGGRELCVLEKTESDYAFTSFSADGRILAVARGTGVDLHDVATGKVIRQLDGHGGKALSVAFGRGDQLISTDKEGVVRTWDAESGKELRKGLPGFPADYDQGYRDVVALALSPDGATAAFVGSSTVVRLWDVSAGRALIEHPGHDRALSVVASSPDGRVVATGAGGGREPVRLWEARTGRLLASCGKSSAFAVRLVFSADGCELIGRVAAGSATEEYAGIVVWDAASGREVRRLAIDGPDGLSTSSVDHFVVLPDGKTLRAIVSSGDPVPVGDGVAPNTYVTAVYDWDLKSTERRRLWRKPIRGGNLSVLSPDGRLMTADDEVTIDVLEVATGRIYREIRYGHCLRPADIAFTADGRLVAVPSLESAPDDKIKWSASVWDETTGQRIGRFAAPGGGITLAFSPDMQTLAVAGVESAPIVLWDVASGRELQRLPAQESYVTALAFTPDGRSLISALADGTAVIWDVSRAADASAAGRGDSSLDSFERAWAALAGDDGAAALRAIATFAAAPEKATTFLTARLSPVAAAAPRLPRLIADLDSDDFKTRESAAGELEALGREAESALQAALKERPSAELKRRLEGLLAGVDGPATDPETVRRLRAVAALERIGATALLRKLAGGAVNARLTLEAQTSLNRLEARKAAAP